jgi:hypothetical protein
MNGWGYFWGMVVGIVLALVLGVPQFNLNPLQAFPFLFLLCIGAVFAGSLLTKPTDMEVLKHFYLKTRPWGFWDPVHAAFVAEGRNIQKNTDFARDMTNVAVGIVWQTALVAAPIFFVIQNWTSLYICLALIVVTSIFLKVSWYDRLRDYPDDLKPEEATAPAPALNTDGAKAATT